jgi:hypothetical protein
MVGPRPAGAPWTPDDDRKLAAAGDDKTIMARKLKRPVTAIKARLAKLRQRERRTKSAASAGKRGTI